MAEPLTVNPEDDMTMEPVADCEYSGKPLHDGDDYGFAPEGIVWVCRTPAEEDTRLQEEFGWIGVDKGDTAGKYVPVAPITCEPGP